MRKTILIICALLAASCVWGPIESSRVVLSLGEGRSLTNSGNLNFDNNKVLVLRIASLDGLTVYAEKTFSSSSAKYSLEVDNLSQNQTYRALAFYKTPDNTIIYMDTRQFFLTGETQIVPLKLGHAAKIILNTPLQSYPIQTLNPIHFLASGSASQLDPGAKIQLVIQNQHTSTLTSFEYRVNDGVWNSVSASTQPVINFPNFDTYTIQVRYRQESNGEWLVYTFVISYLV